ncbi:ankyrin repeat-containing domain protein [Aspergillus aurantiobrunneus]
MSLLALPNELLLTVAAYLNSQSAINALMQVNHRLYHLLNIELCLLNIKRLRGSGILWAARMNFLSVVERFVSAGFDLSTCQGDHPIFDASEHGHIEVVQYILNKGADPNLRRYGNRTSVYLASRGGFLSVVQLLFDSGANDYHDCNDTWSVRGTPIQAAAFNGHTRVVEYFLSRSGRDRDLASLCFPDAAISGNTDLISLLLQHGGDVNFQGMTATRSYGLSALAYAAGHGHVELVRFLLEIGADPNGKGEPLDRSSPIEEAIWGDYESIVKILLEQDLDNLEYVLFEACRDHKLEMVNLLLTKCEIDTQNESLNPLVASAESGDLELIQLFLSKGLNPEPALLEAVSFCHPEVARFLLEAGTDPNVPSTQENAVAKAFLHRNVAIIEVLLHHGAYILPETLEHWQQHGSEKMIALSKQFPVFPN